MTCATCLAFSYPCEHEPARVGQPCVVLSAAGKAPRVGRVLSWSEDGYYLHIVTINGQRLTWTEPYVQLWDTLDEAEAQVRLIASESADCR